MSGPHYRTRLFQYKFEGATMLGFETITLVPYEPNMIDYSLLTEKQVCNFIYLHEPAYVKVITNN